MIKRSVYIKRGTTTDWQKTDENTTLGPGEIGVEYLEDGKSPNYRIKIGPDSETGTKTQFGDIPYSSPDQTIYTSSGITYSSSATIAATTGTISIKNVANPTVASDAANKSYVDTYKLRTVDTSTAVSTGTAMINFLDSSSMDISNYIGSVTFPMITFSDPGSISFDINFFGINMNSAKYVLVAYSGPIGFSAGGNHSGGFQVLYHYITPSSGDIISFNISVDSNKTSGVCYPVIFIFKANYQE